MLDTRADIIKRIVSEGQEETLLRQLETTRSVPDGAHYKAFLEVLVFLIEWSNYRDAASKILVDSIIKNYAFEHGLSIEQRRIIFLETFYESVPEPFINNSLFLRQLLLHFARNENSIDAQLFSNFMSFQQFLEINEEYLKRYLSNRALDSIGMNLFYGCINGIVDGKVCLSKGSIQILQKKLEEVPSILFYLRNFIRPYWYSENTSAEEDFWYVPEPFFEQIFGSKNGFLIFLNTLNLDQELRMIVQEIQSIVSLLDESTPPVFDIRYFRPNPKYHLNLRKRDKRKSYL